MPEIDLQLIPIFRIAIRNNSNEIQKNEKNYSHQLTFMIFWTTLLFAVVR